MKRWRILSILKIKNNFFQSHHHPIPPVLSPNFQPTPKLFSQPQQNSPLNLTFIPSQLFCKNSYFLNKNFDPFPNFLLPFFFCFCFKLPPISIPKKSHRKVFHNSIKTFFIPKPFNTFPPCFNLPSSNPVDSLNQITNPC